jgi:hypothetical protein
MESGFKRVIVMVTVTSLMMWAGNAKMYHGDSVWKDDNKCINYYTEGVKELDWKRTRLETLNLTGDRTLGDQECSKFCLQEFLKTLSEPNEAYDVFCCQKIIRISSIMPYQMCEAYAFNGIQIEHVIEKATPELPPVNENKENSNTSNNRLLNLFGPCSKPKNSEQRWTYNAIAMTADDVFLQKEKAVEERDEATRKEKQIVKDLGKAKKQVEKFGKDLIEQEKTIGEKAENLRKREKEFEDDIHKNVELLEYFQGF